MGVLAMKVIRPRETVNGLNPNDLVKYALSLKGVNVADKKIDELCKAQVRKDGRLKKQHKTSNRKLMTHAKFKIQKLLKTIIKS